MYPIKVGFWVLPSLSAPIFLAGLIFTAAIMAACGQAVLNPTLEPTPTTTALESRSAKAPPTEPPTAAPRTPSPRPTDVIVEIEVSPPFEPIEMMPTIPLTGQTVLESENFSYFESEIFSPPTIEIISRWTERIYDEVSSVLGAKLGERVMISLQPPDKRDCPARGLMLLAEEGTRMVVFADEQTTDIQIQAVLAHELAHAIHLTGMEDIRRAGPELTEGLATWASRSYWAEWHQAESLEEMVRGYLAEDAYVPLSEADVFRHYPGSEESETADCLAQRDQLYTEWGSFTGYLIDTYGWDKYSALTATAVSEVVGEEVIEQSPIDYLAVYGENLQALESSWLVQVQSTP